MADKDAKDLTMLGGFPAGPQFAPAHAKTSAHEAGFANDSKDKGRMTWAGIAVASHPSWEGWTLVLAGLARLGLTAAMTIDARPVWKMVTLELRKDAELQRMVDAFYEAKYWKPLGLLPTDFQEWAEAAYDSAVNFGIEPGKEKLAIMRKAGA